jgi:hypothetical protein
MGGSRAALALSAFCASDCEDGNRLVRKSRFGHRSDGRQGRGKLRFRNLAYDLRRPVFDLCVASLDLDDWEPSTAPVSHPPLIEPGGRRWRYAIQM